MPHLARVLDVQNPPPNPPPSATDFGRFSTPTLHVRGGASRRPVSHFRNSLPSPAPGFRTPPSRLAPPIPTFAHAPGARYARRADPLSIPQAFIARLIDGLSDDHDIRMLCHAMLGKLAAMPSAAPVCRVGEGRSCPVYWECPLALAATPSRGAGDAHGEVQGTAEEGEGCSHRAAPLRHPPRQRSMPPACQSSLSQPPADAPSSHPARSPQVLLSSVDAIVDPLRKTICATLKDNAVPQQVT